MPVWVKILLAITFVACWGPFIYARKLAREDGKTDGAIPLWFGGIQSYYLVTSVLKKHSEEGDRWARRAYWVYCIGLAVVPTLIVALGVQQFWSR
jgi:hypothetical protein